VLYSVVYSFQCVPIHWWGGGGEEGGVENDRKHTRYNTPPTVHKQRRRNLTGERNDNTHADVRCRILIPFVDYYYYSLPLIVVMWVREGRGPEGKIRGHILTRGTPTAEHMKFTSILEDLDYNKSSTS